MQSQIFAPPANERVHRGVVPNIGAVPTMLSEVDRVEMRRRANAVDEDQLVLRTVERAHASVRLVPEAQLQEVAIAPLLTAATSSMCRQSIQTKCTAPSRETRAQAPRVS